MRIGSNAKDCALLGDKVDDLVSYQSSYLPEWAMRAHLATPAVPEHTPVPDVRIRVFQLLHAFVDPGDVLAWLGLPAKELTELLTLLICVRWVP